MENENLLAGNVGYLREAMVVLGELDKAKAQEEEYGASLKKLRSELEWEEKALKEEIDVTIKKRKEEIASSFDKEVRKDQDKIRKIKTKRDKAKTKGMQERIEDETQEIRGENRQIQMNIRSVIKENRLPGFCSYKMYYLLFYPKGVEHLILFFLMTLCLAALPYGIFMLLPEKTPLFMLLICYLCTVILIAIYQLISNRTRGAKWAEIRQIRAMRDNIAANHKKIKAIKNAVQKDRNEQGYDLEHYDEEIAALEEEVRTTLTEKQEALTVFENTTKDIIVEEIQGRAAQKIEALKQAQVQAAASLKEAEQSVKDVSKYITANYEAFLGRDCVNRDAIGEMIAIMEEEKIPTVAEALALYKSER